jgi:hypothetical protein
MNSNTGTSILTGQEIIKENFGGDEVKEINDAYNRVKKFIKKDKDFNEMDFNDYKHIISKIDKKLKNKDHKLKKEDIDLLKRSRRIIFIIISPLSRFVHKNSVFMDSIKDGNLVILDGIEMAPSQIPEKISSL